MINDLIVVFKNFNRYDHLNLSIKSVKRFIKEDHIYCLDMYHEHSNSAMLINLPKQNIFKIKSKFYYDKTNRTIYVDGLNDANWLKQKHFECSTYYDHPHDVTYCNFGDLPNSINTMFFSESYNFIYNQFKHLDKKILCINEDQFFTTGETLKELQQNDFDLAWANWCWPTEQTVNGSILCFIPSKCSSVFPLPEIPVYVDACYYEYIVKRQSNKIKLYKMINRQGENYNGDGIRTNSYNEMLNYIQTTCPDILNY